MKKNNLCGLFITGSIALFCITACKKSGGQAPSTIPNDFSISAAATAALPSPALISYVETNNNNLNNMGLFTVKGATGITNGSPIVNVACIFAGNINLDQETTPKAVVSLNAQTYYLLQETKYVKNLQAKGIKVTLSLLDNHDASGWSEFTTQADANYFAQSVQATLNKYGLDGVEIDDEYSNGNPNDKSLPMVVAAIRKLMPTKIIGLYLYGLDDTEIKNTAASITYAITNFGGGFTDYTGDGIPASKTFVETSSGSVGSTATTAKSSKGGGVMLFDANSGSLSDFQAFAKACYGSKAVVSATGLAPDGPDNGNEPVEPIDKDANGNILDVHYYVLPGTSGGANIVRSK